MFKPGDKVKINQDFPFLYGIDSDIDKNKSYTVKSTETEIDFITLIEIYEHYHGGLQIYYPRYNSDIFKLDIKTTRKLKLEKLCLKSVI